MDDEFVTIDLLHEYIDKMVIVLSSIHKRLDLLENPCKSALHEQEWEANNIRNDK